ncbi:MAG TPA: PQQ-dependent sugar dehydrogenase, partial [Acidimicrobiia bacterium]
MALVVGTLAVGLPEPARAAVTIPAGFIEGTVADVSAPTDLAFLPDGRMLVSSKPGVLRMIKNDVVLPTPVVDLSAKVCSRREEGLGAVAVDPAYSTNHFVYLFYTFNRVGTCYTYDDGSIVLTKGPVNRLSRFVLPAGSDVIDPASEVVILDNMAALGMHNGGDIEFGADGLLYVTVGDAGCRVTDQTKCQASNDNARSLALPLGKVLRVTRNGAVPADNPYASAPGARRCTNPAGVPPGSGPCSEIFATGLRNPFRFSFKPGTNTFHINDVGLALWEEIDLGAKGADYGWNVREGHCATR